MRIAIIVKDFPPDMIGGTETQTKRMATALTDYDHDITVFTKRYGDHDDTETPFEVVRVPNLRLSPFVSTLTFLLACTIILVRHADEFDICQCMMIYPNGFLGYVVRRLTGLPYLAWIRGGDYYFMKDTMWKRWMIKRVLRDTRVLVQAPGIKTDIETEFPDIDHELAVLGNGVEIPEATADGDDVLFVGRLAPMKGVSILIQAMAELDTSITIVGDGSERNRLESLAAEVGADVTFVGEVPPDVVDEYYRTAGVFCLPSTGEEGLPNAVLEAMSWGLPCVTTDSGGLPSLIGNDNRGIIVPKNQPSILRERIAELLEDPDRRTKIGENAREYVVMNHSWMAVVDSLESHYAAVITNSSSGSR
jgi:glycosyltransferase involved in cell wall biosynthesis